MKKTLYLLLLSLTSFSQTIETKDDIKTPSNSSFNLISNVNQSTGKIKESQTITSIKCRSVSFDVIFNYDGANVFKQAKFQNRYFPTSVLGVGWNMAYPKIVAETKQTASRDDDTFYLNGVELICVKRPSPALIGTGVRIWEFKPKKQLNYIIKYYEYNVDYNYSNFQVYDLDYWEVIDDKGFKFTYGFSDNSRETLISWGNWIGDSKNTLGAKQHTIVWNLSKITDQWNNKLSFSYQKAEQPLVGTNFKQTEASYLKEIISDTGEKVVFEYLTKTAPEYYEPNIEAPEPDAYQERYEKLYLNSVKSYNSSNNIITNVELSYLITTALTIQNTKRYLTEIKIKNSANNFLPSQKFEYYTNGTFAGGLKSKMTPKGGKVEYTYENKYAFTNNDLTINNGLTYGMFGYNKYGTYHNNNYSLQLWTNNFDLNTLGGWSDGMVPFFLERKDWDGRKWIKSRYYIPENIRLYARFNGVHYLSNVKFVFGDNYYAMLIYNRDTKYGNLYLFHKLSDGTWNTSIKGNIHTGGLNNDFFNNGFKEDPELFAGEDFVAVGTAKLGKIHTYRWNNLSWNYKLINQNAGQFYYAVKNNFIISLDITSGVDMTTSDFPPNSSNNYDKYYIHYLNSEKEWKTKSWSSFATSNIGNVSDISFFYPSNSMTSFVAANNPEYLLRWDTNYNLNKVENILGSHNDNYPFLSIGGNIYAGTRVAYLQRAKVFKAAAISGDQSIVSPDLNIETEQGFGFNKILGLRWSGNQFAHELRKFNPNTNSWTSQDLPFINTPYNYTYGSCYAFSNDLFISGTHLNRIHNNGFTPLGLGSSYAYPQFCFSGGDYIFGTFKSVNYNSDNLGETRYFYVDKVDGTLKNILLSSTFENLYSYNHGNRRGQQFGGLYPFFSSKNLMGKRLFDYQNGNNVYDIVIKSVKSDNGSGQFSYINFDYENSNTLLDSETVIYGTVKIEEKGAGFNSNGFVKHFYNNGLVDPSKSGLLEKEEYWNNSNQKIKEIVNTYTKNHYPIYNSISQTTPIYYYLDIKKTKTVESTIFIGTGRISKTTDFVYSQNGNLIESSIVNSEGKVEKINYTYADDYYPVLKTKNLLGFIHKKVNRINNEIVSCEKLDWTQVNDKSFVNKNFSGLNENELRLYSEIKKVDDFGNVIEIKDVKGLTKSVLMGYNNKYPIATILNADYTSVINALEISYSDLQLLNGQNLLDELEKLYLNLSKDVMIVLNIYDEYGNIIKTVDEREDVLNYTYDDFRRLKYITDKSGRVVKSLDYNYKSQ